MGCSFPTQIQITPEECDGIIGHHIATIKVRPRNTFDPATAAANMRQLADEPLFRNGVTPNVSTLWEVELKPDL